MSKNLRTCVALLLFAVGFSLGLLALREAAQSPPPPLMAERLAEFERERHGYDVLFFGSSRIFRGVDPQVFDREMARHGHPTRSFNLAFPGMRSHEMNAWMREVLADPPARLRHVLIELDEWPVVIHDRLPIETSVETGRYSARTVAWHDGIETISVLRSISISDEPLHQKIALAASHLAHWGVRAFGIGQAGRAVRDRLEVADEGSGPTASGRRGFTPYTTEDFHGGFPFLFRTQFLETIDDYHEAVATLVEDNRADAPLDTYNVRALMHQVELVRSKGATPLYVLPPRGEATPRLLALAATGVVPTLLDFGRPDLYPGLFVDSSRFDAQHLTPSGAALFSRLLADRFADWLKNRGQGR